MTIRHAAAAAAVAAAATLALANGGAAAKGPGGAGHGAGAHAFAFKSQMLAHRHGNHRRNNANTNALGWPLYGYYAMPPYDGYAGQGGEGSPAFVIVRDDQPPKLSCDKHRETVTVPSESGGTRDITVTRC